MFCRDCFLGYFVIQEIIYEIAQKTHLRRVIVLNVCLDRVPNLFLFQKFCDVINVWGHVTVSFPGSVWIGGGLVIVISFLPNPLKLNKPRNRSNQPVHFLQRYGCLQRPQKLYRLTCREQFNRNHAFNVAEDLRRYLLVGFQRAQL